ncbi:hypothetical protein GW796_10695 [archaeon]|nr:hypothetical protein [archaeon]NCQ52330.1 hypothetical protein [archaeon]
MKSLGVSVTSSKIFYSIYDSKEKTICSNKITLLEDIDFPKKLKDIRIKFLDLLTKNNIQTVGLKIAEKMH